MTNSTSATDSTTAPPSPPPPPPPPIRRIVTGHAPSGKAIFEDERILEPFDARPPGFQDPNDPSGTGPPQVTFVNIFRTAGFPAAVQGPWAENNGKHISLSDTNATTLRAVDWAPRTTSPMHRTVSLDFGVVLRGEVVCELDDGSERVCRAGDVVVQRGTVHAWHNRSDDWARVLFCLVPAQKVKVGESGEELEATSIGALKFEDDK